MINYQEALGIIATNTRAMETESIMPACGRVCAAPVTSPVDLPGFANSAMDGFAVIAADGGSGTTRLNVLGTITAGMAAPMGPPQPGTAWEIMTGAPVPDGYDAVIPVEKTTRRADIVELETSLIAGANVRNPGEDFSTGMQALSTGTAVTPEIIMGLAALGLNHISAYKQPKVSIITTGNEISSKKADNSKGVILDSNRPYLEAAVKQSGAMLINSRSVSDEAGALATAIAEAAADADIILTTGGVSAGRMDFVPEVLRGLGAEILFHKVAIRPGKPLLFARMPNGTLIFGLPGNPMAVAVGWRFFVVEAIRLMLGQQPATCSAARLVNGAGSRAGLRFFAKARSAVTAAGELEVEVLGGQESFKISPLMQANCWAIFTETDEQCMAGDQILIAPLG